MVPRVWVSICGCRKKISITCAVGPFKVLKFFCIQPVNFGNRLTKAVVNPPIFTVVFFIFAGEIPQLGKYYYRIPLDHDVVFAVRPNIMNTTASLIENYSKEQRKCVAEGERKLVFFTKYTQRNCQLDNIALRTARKCGAFSLLVFFLSTVYLTFYRSTGNLFVLLSSNVGCVTFSTPRLRQYNTPICRFSVEMECVKSVEINLMKAILHKKAISYNCLPSCVMRL